MNRQLSLLAAFGVVVACAFSLTGQDKAENKKAPPVFQVKFETTVGNFIVEVKREWSPNGADRIYKLVTSKFFDECKFFRAVEGFMVQFGINGDPKVMAQWSNARIKDDPVMKSNKRGAVTFAKGGRDSRSTQIFINFADNKNLDSMGFSPFGQVIEGMEVVDKINKEYGEAPQEEFGKILTSGNKFLEAKYPRLTAIKTARIVEKEEDK